MHSIDKSRTYSIMFGAGIVILVSLAFVFHGAPFAANSSETVQPERAEASNTSTIFPVQTKGTVSYFTADQFAQASAKLVSLELPLKSPNLEGLTTTRAFSEGNILRLHSVLGEETLVSEVDLTVLEILATIDFCTDATIKMFFDYSGQVIESVFSNQGALVKEIVIQAEVCERYLAETKKS